MNILLSNDHAGTELKNEVKKFLESKGYSVNNQFGKQNPWQMKVGTDDESLEWLLDKN